MKAFRICTLISAVILLAACSDNSSSQSAEKGELIPRSTSEKASYYLITTESNGEHLRTVHSRVSSASHGYSVTRIDCDNRRYQDLGFGEGNQSNIKMYDNVQWTELVPGSSKADLAAFVCNRARDDHA
ncbi:hypothetical protein ACT3UM_18620 [Halomonas sp. AOP13-D3-9]